MSLVQESGCQIFKFKTKLTKLKTTLNEAYRHMEALTPMDWTMNILLHIYSIFVFDSTRWFSNHTFILLCFVLFLLQSCEKQKSNHTKRLVFYSRIYCHQTKSCLIKWSQFIKSLLCVSFLCDNHLCDIKVNHSYG